MSDVSDFQLSRIYAAGWNAARKLPEQETAGLDREKIATMAPYKTAVEIDRWVEGFVNALK